MVDFVGVVSEPTPTRPYPQFHMDQFTLSVQLSVQLLVLEYLWVLLLALVSL
jgi:hypothetical protein